MAALARTQVLVAGLGGVGSWCAEALVRSGVGKVALVDSDRVCVTNINRQVEATIATIGQPKTTALRERLLAINPRCMVTEFPTVISAETLGVNRPIDLTGCDYVIDAIDTLTGKLDLIQAATAAGITVFSSMGMARKEDPTQLRTAGIWDTTGCPLARLVRAGLRKRGFTGTFCTVFSPEPPRAHAGTAEQTSCGSGACHCPPVSGESDSREWCASRKQINGSLITVTATAGMILAGLVLQDVEHTGTYG